MEIQKYWQQAAGDSDRNYVDLCLRWGVILNGPGYAGAWPECRLQLKKDNWSSRKITDLKRFCEDISDQDIVVLRMGTSKVLGVGIVVGGYEWNDSFGDVDGWDLQHVRRVSWLWKGTKTFDTYALKQGDTTQELTSNEVLAWIRGLNLDLKQSEPLRLLPSENDSSDIRFDEVADALFDYGVSNNSIDTLSSEINELIRIARWYQKHQSPSEFETVAYLAIPLLRALGWTPQKMAVEWNKVDVALFRNLPRKDDNLHVVVEAKKKGNSCLTAVSQAESYAKNKQNCQRLIVTDGLRYGIYVKQGDAFELYAYFNLTRMKDCYPIYACAGASEALKAMTPEWDHALKNREGV